MFERREIRRDPLAFVALGRIGFLRYSLVDVVDGTSLDDESVFEALRLPVTVV